VPAAPKIPDLTGSATILLVEDEEAVRSFAARALTSRGYRVYEASTGVEALEVMEESGGQVDLVVSDVAMPELDGPSLLRELRKTRPGIIFVRAMPRRRARGTSPKARPSTSCRSPSRSRSWRWRSRSRWGGRGVRSCPSGRKAIP
jgi:CheY-like chemotaxis protein